MTTKDVLALALTPELVGQWGELKTELMGNGDSHEVVVITFTRLRHLFDAAITAIKQAKEQESEPAKDGKTWSAYVAGIICCYLGKPLDCKEERAIAGIIERRLWALPAPPVQSQQAITPETGNAAPPEASAITAGNGQAQEPVDAKRIAECLAVLRPKVKRLWPHEQALEELVRYAAHPAPKQAEPCRPDILEKLTYHRLERDDMTLDECLTYLQTGGWHKVRGRADYEMVLQLTELLAAAPTPPEAKA